MIYSIFHAVDFDGMGSAAVVYDFYTKAGRGAELVLIPFDRGYDIPDYMSWDSDATVIISDISLPRADMEKLLKKYGERLIWCDHHITSIKEMDGLEINGLQRVDFSGVELTWKFLHNDLSDGREKLPMVVNYIGAYDIRRLFKNSLEFYTGLEFFDELRKPSSPLWIKLLENDKILLEEILRVGKILFDSMIKQEKIVSENIHFVEFEGYKVPAVNSLSSRDRDRAFTLHNSGDLFQEYPFVVSYYFKKNMWKVSLRSNKNMNFDTTEISQKYNGGGHRNASGFMCDILPWVNV